MQFDEKMCEKKIRYDYFIWDIKRTKKKLEFVFVLHIVPKTKEIEEILKYTPGLNHYRMTIKHVNDNTQIETIELLYGEI